MILNDIINFMSTSTNHKDIGILYFFEALGAGLFFDFFVSSTEVDLSFCVVSFMSLVSKIKPKVLYMGGSVLSNHVQNRHYSARPLGIGKVCWDPNKYSSETQIMIQELKVYCINEDKKAVYDTMYAVLGNFDGIFSKSFGKVQSLVNNTVDSYNKDHDENSITEKEFLELYGFKFSDSDLSFLDKTNRGTIMSNISEILAPQILMAQKKNALVERSLVLQDKVNLSGQTHPEFSIGLFIDKKDISNSTVVIYDSDLKTTDDLSLGLKLDTLKKGMEYSATSYKKEIFGMNVIVVASHQDQNSEIIFSPEEVLTLVKYIKNSALKNPKLFESFDENSEGFRNFVSTGKAKYLNESDFPSPRIYRPNEFYKLPHNTEVFDKTKAYQTVQKLHERRSCVKEKSDIALNDDETNY